MIKKPPDANSSNLKVDILSREYYYLRQDETAEEILSIKYDIDNIADILYKKKHKKHKKKKKKSPIRKSFWNYLSKFCK